MRAVSCHSSNQYNYLTAAGAHMVEQSKGVSVYPQGYGVAIANGAYTVGGAPTQPFLYSQAAPMVGKSMPPNHMMHPTMGAEAAIPIQMRTMAAQMPPHVANLPVSTQQATQNSAHRAAIPPNACAQVTQASHDELCVQ